MTLLEAYITIVFFGIILMCVLIPVALEVIRDVRKLLKRVLKIKRHV